MDPFTALVLSVVLATAAMYVLYFVVRAADRDGIQLARKAEQNAGPEASRPVLFHPDDER